MSNSDSFINTGEDSAQNKMLTKNQIKRLRNLKIKLNYKVLEQHKIEKHAGTRLLTNKEKKQFEKYHVLKNGAFNKQEDEILQNNWNKFCELHNWDPDFPEPFANKTYNSGGQLLMPLLEERKHFAQFLANGLPSRTLYSVVKRFKNIYHTKNCKKFTRYSKKEDDIIMKYMKGINMEKKYSHHNYAKIGTILGRTRSSVCERHKKLLQLKNKNNKTKVSWTLELCNQLLKNLLNLTLSSNIEQLKNAIIPKVVWVELEGKIGVKYNVAQYYWYQRLHLQLFSSKPIYIEHIKIRLIELMYNMRIKEFTDFKWSNLVKYFDGVTPFYLTKVFNNLLARIEMKMRTKNLEFKIKYLYKQYIPKLLMSNKQTMLWRLEYNNNELRVHPEYNLVTNQKVDDDNFSEDDLSIDENSSDFLYNCNFLTIDSDYNLSNNLNNEDLVSTLPLNCDETKEEDDENDLSDKKSITLHSKNETHSDYNLSDNLDNDDLVSSPSLNYDEVKEQDNEQTDLPDKKSIIVHSKNGTPKTEILFTLELYTKLVVNLLDLTLSRNIMQLKNAIIPTVVWKKLEQRMNIESNELKKCWLLKLHLQLFSSKPIYLNDIKIKLIERIVKLQISSFDNIQWVKLVNYFNGTTPFFLKHVFESLVSTVREELKIEDSKSILKYLYTQEISKLLKSRTDQFLMRLEFINNELRILSQDDLNIKKELKEGINESDFSENENNILLSEFKVERIDDSYDKLSDEDAIYFYSS